MEVQDNLRKVSPLSIIQGRDFRQLEEVRKNLWQQVQDLVIFSE